MKTPKTKRTLSRAESTTATQRKIAAMLAKESPADRNASLFNSAAQLLTEFADGSIEDRDLSVVSETIKELLTLATAAAQTAPAPAKESPAIGVEIEGGTVARFVYPATMNPRPRFYIVDMDCQDEESEAQSKQCASEMDAEIAAGTAIEVLN